LKYRSWFFQYLSSLLCSLLSPRTRAANFPFGFWEILKPLKWTNITSFFLIWLKRSTKIVYFSVNLNKILCFIYITGTCFFKGFNISQKPKSSPLSYFVQKTSLNLAPNWYPIIFTCPFQSDSCSYISNIDISVH
jgi:hypothetical protein